MHSGVRLQDGEFRRNYRSPFDESQPLEPLGTAQLNLIFENNTVIFLDLLEPATI
jgi:hypothetical protein